MIRATSNFIRLLPLILVAVILSGCNQRANTYFEKQLSFPDLLTKDQKVKLAAYIVPTESQYEWQQLELIAFIHFGINTFTERELGDGSEDPNLFNPTNFDAEQWVETLKNAGFKMIVLAAKDQDGFCLWPTQTTNHSVVSSSWLNGKGDIVKAVRDACEKHDMKFGVYLSPTDRNAESYADSPEYNQLFEQQLTELLTNYGEIHKVLLDPANIDNQNGKILDYDWTRFNHVIDSLQPTTVKAIMGNDVRWIGSENGLGRETEWSVTPLQPNINKTLIAENIRLNITPTSEDLGSNELIVESKFIYWYPSVVNVSIRPDSFYNAEQDSEVKTLAQLVDTYFQSVGMNSVLMLNVPPDKRGRINNIDADRLNQFGDYINSTFNNEKLTDGDVEWKAKSGNSKEFTVLDGQIINTVMLQEDILKGQRVEEFLIEGLTNDNWIKLSEGTTIGYKRLVRFADTQPTKIRITIEETRDIANIKKIGAYYAPVLKGSIMEVAALATISDSTSVK